MDGNQYGPFEDIVKVAGALVATFSLFYEKMLGSIKRLSWLTKDSPTFLVTGGAKVLTLAAMVIIYVTIDTDNWCFFAAGMVVIAVFCCINIIRFDLLRRHHVVAVPNVGPDGSQLRDRRQKELYTYLVIGTECELKTKVADSLNNARKCDPGLTLVQFMAGYGTRAVNNPEALWDRCILAELAHRLTRTLMYVVLSSVLTLFLAANVILQHAKIK